MNKNISPLHSYPKQDVSGLIPLPIPTCLISFPSRFSSYQQLDTSRSEDNSMRSDRESGLASWMKRLSLKRFLFRQEVWSSRWSSCWTLWGHVFALYLSKAKFSQNRGIKSNMIFNVTVVLLNISVTFFQDSLMNSKEQHLFQIYIFVRF